MKMALAAMLLLAAIVQATAQQQLGFSPSAIPGSSIKLDGFTMQPVPGGYLALSVPPKDIERLLLVAIKMEPHLLALEVLERLNNETKKIVQISSLAKWLGNRWRRLRAEWSARTRTTSCPD